MTDPTDGTAASGIGLPILSGLEKVWTVWQFINSTRDMLANHITSGSHAQSQITGLPAALTTLTTDTAAAAAAASTANGLAVQARAGDVDISVWNRDVGSMTRRAVWMGNSGPVLFGWTSSLRANKEDHGPAPLTAEQLRAIPVVYYKYLAALERQKAHPRKFRAALEIGSYADDLHKLGLWPFVIYEGRGKNAQPIGIHYELLGLAALKLGQLAYDELDTLKDRVSALEAKLNGADDGAR